MGADAPEYPRHHLETFRQEMGKIERLLKWPAGVGASAASSGTP